MKIELGEPLFMSIYRWDGERLRCSHMTPDLREYCTRELAIHDAHRLAKWIQENIPVEKGG